MSNNGQMWAKKNVPRKTGMWKDGVFADKQNIDNKFIRLALNQDKKLF